MSALAEERGWMTIGEVLSLINRDFPEMSISKIRFLEGEGLIAPQRAKSGYRRFTADDVEQLRLVLVAQRDRYLPLRVIKDHLLTGTLAEVVHPEPQVEVQVLRSESEVDDPESPRRIPDIDPRAQFTRLEVREQSGLTAEQVTELVEAGVLQPDPSGRFGGCDVLLCRAYRVLVEFGVDHRHLRQAKNVSSRESSLILNAVGHLDGADRLEAAGTMLDALGDVHHWLVLRDVHAQGPASGHRPRRSGR